MRVARSHQSLDDRRRVVVDLLTFIHDFNQLDTTLLIDKAQADFEFVEAAETILQSAVGPWKSIEALRDFAVQALGGEKPMPVRDMERVRPRGRVSPFSVPFDLLRAVVPHRGQFNPAKLRSLSKVVELELPDGRTWDHELQVPQDQWWLVTTMWARAVPGYSRYRGVKIEVQDTGANRILHDGPLQALYEEPMPCFWPLLPNTALRPTVRGYEHDYAPMMVLIAFEGWIYRWE